MVNDIQEGFVSLNKAAELTGKSTSTLSSYIDREKLKNYADNVGNEKRRKIQISVKELLDIFPKKQPEKIHEFKKRVTELEKVILQKEKEIVELKEKITIMKDELLDTFEIPDVFGSLEDTDKDRKIDLENKVSKFIGFVESGIHPLVIRNSEITLEEKRREQDVNDYLFSLMTALNNYIVKRNSFFNDTYLRRKNNVLKFNYCVSEAFVYNSIFPTPYSYKNLCNNNYLQDYSNNFIPFPMLNSKFLDFSYRKGYYKIYFQHLQNLNF